MAASKSFRLILVAVVAVILAITAVFYFNEPSRAKNVEYPTNTIDPAFSAFISSYTAGVISSQSSIRIRLAMDVADSAQIGKQLEETVFDFDPKINGEALWLDARTIEFTPEKSLVSGQLYKVNFHLSKLMEVSENLSTLTYNFQVIHQDYDLSVENVATVADTDFRTQEIKGVLNTADKADEKQVEKMLVAEQGGQKLPVKWTHVQNEHYFVIGDVKRGDSKSEVDLEVNGEALGIDKEMEEDVYIPPLGDFTVTNVKVIQSPSQYVLVQFSDPLQADQELKGLVKVSGVYSLNYDVKGNELYVYLPTRQVGDKYVSVFKGIKNAKGSRLGGESKYQVTFSQISPDVRLLGKGNILPSSEGLIFPFEAVNLKAVDVEIIKVYEDNVIQFLQANDFDGSTELRRVGKPVLRKTVALNTSGIVDLSKWNRFTLDLSQLINAEVGAIYQVRISFRRYQSVFFCGEAPEEEDMMPLEESNWEDDDKMFSRYDSYRRYKYTSDYRWSERDNPCHVTYYLEHEGVKRNVLASDLGLMAKRGNSGEILVVVTDLKTAQPISGVKVEAYDFQQQLLNTIETDANGVAHMPAGRRPFLVKATSGSQRGYLKMDDGSSLSLSNFDVSGSEVKEGIKGYIYGERGVWRPGDTLHLSFVLEDKLKRLPESHPVIMELYNPSWQLVKKEVKTQGENGFYRFDISTDSEAPTGNYTAQVNVGGVQFTKTLKIETVKPNRLKIKLDFGGAKLTSNNNSISGDLQVNWLHGAPARGLKAEFDVKLTPAKTVFDRFRAYTFDDIGRDFYSSSKKIFEGYVDDEGHAKVNASLSADGESPGMLMANFTGKVFEEGGNFSIDNFSLPYYPYNSFVGVKLPESKSWSKLFYNKTNKINVATVDSEGNPISRNGVEIAVYRLSWSWWWDQEDESVANYMSRYSVSPVVSGRINTVKGKGTFTFDLNDWGRYYIRVCDPVSGHCTGEVHYTSWGGDQSDMPGGAAMLNFTADKEKYEVGETAVIKIPGSDVGRAFISIENGSRVLQSNWADTKKGETEFAFEVTPDMAPNVYVFVTLLQPHKQTVNDLPIRLYGVIPINVENPSTILKPKIQMPKVLSPGAEVEIKVTEESKKKMTYTVAVVDEGLLDLTHFKTPNAWGSFYAREALGVKTWDIFDYVIGAHGDKVERLLSIGGDEQGDKSKGAKANRFKPVVKYFGPFTLEKGKTNSHKFIMPQYIGSVKTMVVAGYEGAYGSAEEVTPVKQPLMVLGTLPRVLGPEEVVKLPVTVFAGDKRIKNVKVTVATNKLLSVIGEKTKTVSFTEAGDKVVYFDVKVKPAIGIAKVDITATSGQENASHSIELDVRNPNPSITRVYDELLDSRKSLSMDFNSIGMEGTNAAVLEVSNIPSLNLEKRLKYLIRYPHGCIEQTTSSVFPQLYLSKLMELSGVEKNRIEDNIKAGISRLTKFQKSDGGFSYWPGGENSDSWGSTYAGHFLVEAEKHGYKIPAGMLRNWKRYQKQKAAEFRKNNNSYYRSDFIQAYRLYSLALAGAAEKGAMNRLREQGGLTSAAAWRLAGAYALAGQKEAANELIASLPVVVDNYRELSYTYGSSLRDEAMILETLSLLGDRKKAVPVLQAISKEMSSNSWLSTQTTAYCLIAAGQFSGVSSGKSIDFTYSLNGKEIRVTTGMSMAQSELAVKEGGLNKFSLKNNNDTFLYVTLVVAGTPMRGVEESSQHDLRMEMVYKDTDGKYIDPATIEQGMDFEVAVTITNPGLRGDYENMALTQIFPSGWEIHNARLNDMEDFSGQSVPDYQDIRDDRVYTYFDIKANEKKVFKFLLNASYQGEFYMPAVKCEAMYDNTINASFAGKEVRVVKPDRIQ